MEEGYGFGIHLLFTTINFFILITVLFLFGRKKIIEAVKNRGEAIKNEFSTLKMEREEVEKMKMEYLEKLRGLEREMEEIKKKAIEEIERAVENHRRKIMDSSKRFEETIDLLISAEYERAISTVQKEIIDMAMEITKRIIAQKFTEEKEKKLFQEALASIKR